MLSKKSYANPPRNSLTVGKESKVTNLYPKNVLNRFWAKVCVKGQNKCWLWKAGLSKHGYGGFRIDRYETISASRFSLELKIGRKLLKEEHALHDCPGGDNPACVNPKHLWIGSNEDNAYDRHKKGRTAKGEQILKTKLTSKDVLEIRRLHATGRYTLKYIGERFGVTYVSIQYIVKRKRWKHI